MEEEESLRGRAGVTAGGRPIDDGLRRRDRGLSAVEADEPETSDGVRVLDTMSNFGSREAG